MVITVCIGSSCHLKGSRLIVEELQSLVKNSNLQDEVELKGAFCMGNCMEGVSVKIGEEMFSLNPEGTKSFFDNQVVRRLSTNEGAFSEKNKGEGGEKSNDGLFKIQKIEL